MDYRIVWEVDVIADSPTEAAREARAMQQDPEAFCHVYDVFTGTGECVRVDLDELDQEED